MGTSSTTFNPRGIYALIFVLGFMAFWSLRPLAIQSGDYKEYGEDERYGWNRPFYHIREPGSVALWQAIAWGSRWLMHGTDARGMLSPEQRKLGFDLLGAASGGTFLVLLAAFMREARPRRNWLYLPGALVVVTSAVTWTFVGHIEFYAPFEAGLMFMYWRAARYFRSPSPSNFAWTIAAAAVAVTMHRVALFHLPALVLLFRRDSSTMALRRPSRTEVTAILTAFIALAMLQFIPISMAMVWPNTFKVLEDYNWLPELITPLTQGWADYVAAHSRLGSYDLFTFGSRAHWEHFCFFLITASPLGLGVVLLMRRSIQGAFPVFLLAASVSAWIWAFIWHPHLGYGDWDLFTNPGVPTNLLACWLILTIGQSESSRIS